MVCSCDPQTQSPNRTNGQRAIGVQEKQHLPHRIRRAGVHLLRSTRFTLKHFGAQLARDRLRIIRTSAVDDDHFGCIFTSDRLYAPGYERMLIERWDDDANGG